MIGQRTDPGQAHITSMRRDIDADRLIGIREERISSLGALSDTARGGESTPPGDGPDSDFTPEDTTDYGAESSDDIPF